MRLENIMNSNIKCKRCKKFVEINYDNDGSGAYEIYCNNCGSYVDEEGNLIDYSALEDLKDRGFKIFNTEEELRKYMKIIIGVEIFKDGQWNLVSMDDDGIANDNDSGDFSKEGIEKMTRRIIELKNLFYDALKEV